MAKKVTTSTAKSTIHVGASVLLAQFLKDNNIKLDYSIIEERMFQVEDGFVLKPKNPLIKVTVSYE